MMQNKKGCKKCQNTRRSIGHSLKQGNIQQATKKLMIGFKRIVKK